LLAFVDGRWSDPTAVIDWTTCSAAWVSSHVIPRLERLRNPAQGGAGNPPQVPARPTISQNQRGVGDTEWAMKVVSAPLLRLGRRRQNPVSATGAILKDPEVRRAYERAVAAGDADKAGALSSCAAGVIMGLLEGEGRTVGASAIAVLLSNASRPDGAWARSVKEALQQVGFIGKG
jgi:hypothetical protein